MSGRRNQNRRNPRPVRPKGRSTKKNSRKRKNRSGPVTKMIPTFAPTAYGTTVKTGSPMKHVRLTHREFVRDVSSNGTGTQILSHSVNPGLAAEFPWLSTIACSFETYRFTKLNYVFVPVLSSSTDGVIAICPDYDAADDDGSLEKRELLAFEDSVRSNLWSKVTCRCSPSNLNKYKERFTRHGALSSNLDIKLYDAVKMHYLLSDDKADGTLLGEIWVEYSIDLFTPQLTLEAAITSQAFRLTPSCTTSKIFDPVGLSLGNLVTEGIIDLDNGEGQVMKILRAGTYLLNVQIDGLGEDPVYNPVLDSDTGDTILHWMEESWDATNFLASYLFGVGKNASESNPAELTFGTSYPLNWTGNLRWWLSQLTGYTLPTEGDSKKGFDVIKYKKRRKLERDQVAILEKIKSSKVT